MIPTVPSDCSCGLRKYKCEYSICGMKITTMVTNERLSLCGVYGPKLNHDHNQLYPVSISN